MCIYVIECFSVFKKKKRYVNIFIDRYIKKYIKIILVWNLCKNKNK